MHSLRCRILVSIFFTMFVPGQLHEFELGVWKSVFTHLVHILYAIGPHVVPALDLWWASLLNVFILLLILIKSFRQVPTFNETIWRFTNDASSMKKLAARDFEDLLQVVQRPTNSEYWLIGLFTSALFLSLKNYFHAHTMQLSPIYYFLSRLGMPTLNFDFIQSQL